MSVLLLVTLLLSPWNGPALPTQSAGALHYRLAVHGAPNSSVRLQARGLATGWIASFCTDRLCSPFRYTVSLDAHGAAVLEFQAIRVDPSAAHRTRATIDAGTASVSVPLNVP